MFYLFLISARFHKELFNIGQSLFCNYQNDHVISAPTFIYMYVCMYAFVYLFKYLTYGFVYTDMLLHYRYETKVVIIHDHFNILLNLFGKYFVHNIGIHGHWKKLW